MAVLFGRFRLTPEQCKEAFKEIGDSVYTKPQWRIIHTMKYNDELLEDVIIKQTKRYLESECHTEGGPGDGSDVLFRPKTSRVSDKGCRT